MKVGQQGIEVALGGPSNPLKARSRYKNAVPSYLYENICI